MSNLKKPLIISIALLSLLLFGSQLMQDDMVFHRNSINNGQWWKIFTGNLTHSNYPHLLLNLSGLWLLGLLFIDILKAKTFIFSSILLCMFVGYGLYFFNPELNKYYGFSGALYGLFFIAGISSTLLKDYLNGFAVIFLISGKVIWDLIEGAGQASADLIGIPVATDAHFYGLLGALCISFYLILFHFKYKKV